MAVNETVITIVGNVISDLKSRRTGEGVRVVSFRVASNERRYDKAAEQWIDGDRLYVTVTCWRKLAQGAVASLAKGDPVLVTGRLYTRGYEVEGQKRSVTELEALAVGPDLSRCLAEVSRPRREATDDVSAQTEQDGSVVPPQESSSQGVAQPRAGVADREAAPGRRGLAMVGAPSS